LRKFIQMNFLNNFHAVKNFLQSRYRWVVLAMIITLFLAATYFFSTPSATVQTTSMDQTVCPTESNFPELWNTWSREYLATNPSANGEDQTSEWNDLMLGIGCPDWVNPHKKAIDGGSTSDYE
jgi:hypothetical protein